MHWEMKPLPQNLSRGHGVWCEHKSSESFLCVWTGEWWKFQEEAGPQCLFGSGLACENLLWWLAGKCQHLLAKCSGGCFLEVLPWFWGALKRVWIAMLSFDLKGSAGAAGKQRLAKVGCPGKEGWTGQSGSSWSGHVCTWGSLGEELLVTAGLGWVSCLIVLTQF